MNIFIISGLLSLLIINSNANELSWVDEQVEAIKPARDGINNSTISSIKDPFIFLEKNGYKALKKEKPKLTIVKKVKPVEIPKKVYGEKLTLEMIINSSALIDGNWYKIGDNVKGYVLTKVDKSTVGLTFDGKKSVLSMQANNSNLKFKKK